MSRSAGSSKVGDGDSWRAETSLRQLVSRLHNMQLFATVLLQSYPSIWSAKSFEQSRATRAVSSQDKALGSYPNQPTRHSLRVEALIDRLFSIWSPDAMTGV